MTTLAYVTLEPNDDNQDGAAVTLYFVEEPTRQDIEAALNENLDLCLASEDQGFESYTHQPTRDGLVRVQVLPA